MVDQRDIRDISPHDLKPFTQLHFFAGIGGWSLALRQAGWPDSKLVWTGSCPCQPFSSAGKHAGFTDERHLWPVWFTLIKALKPPILFGEQVASKAALRWFDLVSDDLETTGYTLGAADLCAASLGAPHIRQRLWFGATLTKGLANAASHGRQTGLPHPQTIPQKAKGGASNRSCRSSYPKQIPRGQAKTPWQDLEWLHGNDNIWRPTEPGLCPLADGVPNRVGRLRAYGNAIVPQVASQFITCFTEDTLNK